MFTMRARVALGLDAKLHEAGPVLEEYIQESSVSPQSPLVEHPPLQDGEGAPPADGLVLAPHEYTAVVRMYALEVGSLSCLLHSCICLPLPLYPFCNALRCSLAARRAGAYSATRRLLGPSFCLYLDWLRTRMLASVSRTCNSGTAECSIFLSNTSLVILQVLAREGGQAERALDWVLTAAPHLLQTERARLLGELQLIAAADALTLAPGTPPAPRDEAAPSSNGHGAGAGGEPEIVPAPAQERGGGPLARGAALSGGGGPAAGAGKGVSKVSGGVGGNGGGVGDSGAASAGSAEAAGAWLRAAAKRAADLWRDDQACPTPVLCCRAGFGVDAWDIAAVQLAVAGVCGALRPCVVGCRAARDSRCTTRAYICRMGRAPGFAVMSCRNDV